MNLKTATVIAFAGLAVFVIVLRFSDRHAGNSTRATAPAPAFSRPIGETFQCGHGFLATFTAKDAKKAGELYQGS